jgi:hypothetical protein
MYDNDDSAPTAKYELALVSSHAHKARTIDVSGIGIKTLSSRQASAPTQDPDGQE